MRMRWLGTCALVSAIASATVWSSSCAVDPYLTCGDQCVDATTDTLGNPDVPNAGDVGVDGTTSDAGAKDQSADQAVDQSVSDVALGGLDANCHAPDSSTPLWACPNSGCCSTYQNQNYSCNSQGQCCKINGASCGQGTSCCGACANSGGGNGTCVSACVPTNGSCSQSTDCCNNTWCKNSACAACTPQGNACTSNYECCYGYACQSTVDGGKTCQGN